MGVPPTIGRGAGPGERHCAQLGGLGPETAPRHRQVNRAGPYGRLVGLGGIGFKSIPAVHFASMPQVWTRLLA